MEVPNAAEFKREVLRKAIANRYSNRDLAKKANISEATIRNLLSGRIKRPNKATVRTLAEFFGMEVGEFYTDAPLAKEITVDPTDLDHPHAEVQADLVANLNLKGCFLERAVPPGFCRAALIEQTIARCSGIPVHIQADSNATRNDFWLDVNQKISGMGIEPLDFPRVAPARWMRKLREAGQEILFMIEDMDRVFPTDNEDNRSRWSSGDVTLLFKDFKGKRQSAIVIGTISVRAFGSGASKVGSDYLPERIASPLNDDWQRWCRRQAGDDVGKPQVKHVMRESQGQPDAYLKGIAALRQGLALKKVSEWIEQVHECTAWEVLTRLPPKHRKCLADKAWREEGVEHRTIKELLEAGILRRDTDSTGKKLTDGTYALAVPNWERYW